MNGAACTNVCQEGYTNCGTSCADLQSDSQHCLTCDNPCDELYSCTAGKCVSGCKAADTVCPRVGDAAAYCADLSSTYSSCGACGKSCQNSEVCLDTSCACEARLGDFRCPAANNECLPQTNARCGELCLNCGATGATLNGYVRAGYCTPAHQCVYVAPNAVDASVPVPGLQ